MIKKFAAACTAVVLGAALTVGGISTASAEDLPAEEVVPTVVEEVTPVVVEAPAVVEAVVEEPAVVETPEVVETPVEEAVAPVVQERSVAPMTVKETKTVSWLTPYTGATEPATNDPTIWDQVLLTNNDCSDTPQWVQTDIYKYHTAEEKAIVDALIAKGTLKKVNGTPEDSKVYISHVFTKQEACPPPCPEYDFPKDKMWEVTWGWDFENRNGNAPKFTMTSHGGMTGINGGAIPQYMLDYKTGVEWQWLYVTNDRTVTYQFADGTVWTAVVTGTGCTPEIVWTMTPPPVKVPTVEFSYTLECGVLTLHTTSTDINPSWWYGIKATVDGTMVGSAVLQGNGDKVKVINFDEDSYGGSVNVIVETYASTEQDLLPEGWEMGVQHEVTVDTDCEINVPDAPEPESDTKFESTTDCEARTVSTQEFERHTLEPVYNEESNTWTQGEWTDWAPVGEPDVRDATEEECPTPVVPPKVIPPTVPTDILAFTGFNPLPLIGGGGLMALIGSAAIFIGRKRLNGMEL